MLCVKRSSGFGAHFMSVFSFVSLCRADICGLACVLVLVPH